MAAAPTARTNRPRVTQSAQSFHNVAIFTSKIQKMRIPACPALRRGTINDRCRNAVVIRCSVSVWAEEYHDFFSSSDRNSNKIVTSDWFYWFPFKLCARYTAVDIEQDLWKNFNVYEADLPVFWHFVGRIWMRIENVELALSNERYASSKLIVSIAIEIELPAINLIFCDCHKLSAISARRTSFCGKMSAGCSWNVMKNFVFFFSAKLKFWFIRQCQSRDGYLIRVCHAVNFIEFWCRFFLVELMLCD